MQCIYHELEKPFKRCEKPAEGKMVSPDGQDVPGCYYCKQHADIIMAEYKEKLRQEWTLRPLTELEKY